MTGTSDRNGDEVKNSLITPLVVRDTIIKCYYEAQHETFSRAKQRLELPADEAAIYRSMVGAIRLAFRECNGNFDDPTKKDLVKVIEVLADKARNWGTPSAVVENNFKHLSQIIEQL